MTTLKTLSNGVEKFALMVENDFNLAQNILDLASATENIDSEYAYNERVQNRFEGSYKVKIERVEDFNRFENMMSKEQNHLYTEVSIAKDNVYTFFRKGFMTREEAIKKMDELSNKLDKGCDCKKCQFKITFDEWKTGKMSNGAKVGKTLRKNKFSDTLIDFYSAQVKTEVEKFITVASQVQFIAGMSNFAEEDSWNGYGGTSCQDTRLDTSMCIGLGGSLHDNKLFVAMLHDSLEDLEDMQDKLEARVIMRLLTIDGYQVLVPSTYYGNNVTKDILHNGLKQLEEVGIFSKDIRDGYDRHIEATNGHFEMHVHDEVHVCETIDEYVNVECPMCGGSGEYEVYSNHLDKHIEVECPCCGGSGEYEVNVYVDVDEWIEVEEECEIEPYTDDYTHSGYQMSIRVNLERIKEVIQNHLV